MFNLRHSKISLDNKNYKKFANEAVIDIQNLENISQIPHVEYVLFRKSVQNKNAGGCCFEEWWKEKNETIWSTLAWKLVTRQPF